MFELISYINLDYRQDRNEHMLRTLAACPCPFRRIAATRLDRPPEDLGIGMVPRLRGAAGVASIFLSHQKALEDALEAGVSGRFALLEDDVRIDAPFWEMEPEELFPDSEFDILFLSPRYRRKAPGPNGERIYVAKPYGYGFVNLSDAMKDYIVTGAHFLVFPNRSAIVRVLDKMHACTEHMDVDLFYMLTANCLGLHLECIGTAPLGSDHRVDDVEK